MIEERSAVYLRALFIAHQATPAWSTVAAVQIEVAICAIKTRITRQLAVVAKRSR